MLVEFTRHAAVRMATRGIKQEWVMEVLRSPDRTEPDPNDALLTRAFRRITAMEGRVLRVVFSQPRPGVVRVVTAFPDRNAGAGG